MRFLDFLFKPNIQRLKTSRNYYGLFAALRHDDLYESAETALLEILDSVPMRTLVNILSGNDVLACNVICKYIDQSIDLNSLVNRMRSIDGHYLQGLKNSYRINLKVAIELETILIAERTLKGAPGIFSELHIDALILFLELAELLSPKPTDQQRVVKALQHQTGQHFNSDIVAWRRWFDEIYGKKLINDETVELERISNVQLGLTDPSLDSIVNSLMVYVTIVPESPPTQMIIGSDSPMMSAAKAFADLHAAYPDSSEIHYAYAAALQLAGQGETALKVMKECAEAHPNFWLADLYLKRSAALLYWNPFFLPEFKSIVGEKVHPIINQLVQTNVILATRVGVLPHSVMFYRDANDELSTSALKSCKMEFMTTISEVKEPQIVAINGRIHDDPINPLQLEVIECPFQSVSSRARLRFELIARQHDFEFVILDSRGQIKYWRQIKPSTRMTSVHQQVSLMFDETQGKDISIPEFIGAIRRHQTIFDPAKIRY